MRNKIIELKRRIGCVLHEHFRLLIFVFVGMVLIVFIGVVALRYPILSMSSLQRTYEQLRSMSPNEIEALLLDEQSNIKTRICAALYLPHAFSLGDIEGERVKSILDLATKARLEPRVHKAVDFATRSFSETAHWTLKYDYLESFEEYKVFRDFCMIFEINNEDLGFKLLDHCSYSDELN
jgi:hypothetical protein